MLDQLAKTGVRYSQARSDAPVCVPSRCSIITGRFASALGIQNMRSRWEIPADIRYVPELLRAAGGMRQQRQGLSETTDRASSAHTAS